MRNAISGKTKSLRLSFSRLSVPVRPTRRNIAKLRSLNVVVVNGDILYTL